MYGEAFSEAFEATGAAATVSRFVPHVHSSNEIPSLTSPLEAKTMKHNLEIARRNFQRTDRRTIGERVSTRQLTHALADALAPFHAKEIAEASGSSVRAAENAKQGMNAMSLAHFLNACRELPELRALAMELMGCETTIDPEFQRGMSMLMNSLARQQAGRAE